MSILEELPFALARSALSFRRFNEATLRAVGLDKLATGLASVLHAVNELNVSTIGQLVELTHLPNGTLTGLLDKLERSGHLQRIRNPEDGRSRLVQLTSKGKQLCETLNARHRIAMEILEQGLSTSEMATLSRLLEKVTNCMRDNLPEDSKSPAASALSSLPGKQKHLPIKP